MRELEEDALKAQIVIAQVKAMSASSLESLPLGSPDGQRKSSSSENELNDSGLRRTSSSGGSNKTTWYNSTNQWIGQRNHPHKGWPLSGYYGDPVRTSAWEGLETKVTEDLAGKFYWRACQSILTQKSFNQFFLKLNILKVILNLIYNSRYFVLIFLFSLIPLFGRFLIKIEYKL